LGEITEFKHILLSEFGIVVKVQLYINRRYQY
jgi:hypothetical protein